METPITAFPADFDWIRMSVIVLAALLILSLIFRLFKRKCIELSQALCAALSILILIAGAAVCDTLMTGDLSAYLSAIPFVRIENGWLTLLPLSTAQFNSLSYQLLSMVILAFCVNLCDNFLPHGSKFPGWLLWRILGLCLAVAADCAVMWLLEFLMPAVLLTYAARILLGLLVFLLLLGIIKFLLGLILTITSPILGAIYAFFFSNRIGKQLSKAVLTTAILTALAFLLQHFGYTAIPITADVLPSYIPVAAVLVVIWYLTGQIA